MKCAVISLSVEGAVLGASVKRNTAEDITLYERKGAESGERALSFTRTMALVDEIFGKYDGILFIMASGIAIRAIAPHIKNKAADPAVLVMDECGQHCISLLSGHLGGANAWTRRVAKAVGADPVITTATDVHGVLAPDDIAREWHMRVEPLGALKSVNGLLAEGKPFLWFVDRETEGAEDWMLKLKEKGLSCDWYGDSPLFDFAGSAVVSERKLPLNRPHVYLRGRNVYAGIGCKRGTLEEHIAEAFAKALREVGVEPYQVASLSSVSLKADEEGLLRFAKRAKYDIHFYTPLELGEIIETYRLDESAFVKKTIGVGNICESAAMKTALRGKIILRKTRWEGVTVALVAGIST